MRDEWYNHLLARIAELGGEADQRYTADLEHYRRVAEILEHATGDLDLARAGFLHGISTTEIHRYLPNAASPAVLEILRIYENFREFDVTSPTLSRELKASPLRGDYFPHAGILLVVDQLHHLDPRGEISAWSRAFHVDTRNEFEHLPEAAMFEDRFGAWEDRRSFLFIRNVVASIAQSLGMWHERNVLEDAAFLFSDRIGFARILAYASKSSSTRGACSHFVARVRDVLEPMGGTAVRWEWRHIARVAERVAAAAGGETPTPEEAVLECGFVTAVCRDKNRCFEALGRLQCAFGYTAEGVEEVARYHVSGYDAIHVNLQVPVVQEDGERAHLVRTKIIPSDLAERRFAAWERKALVAPAARAQGLEGPRIEVFAPDGRRVSLRPGSTVLNFAFKLHDELVVRLCAAQVNQVWVDALHPLRAGDVVWIDAASTPPRAPPGWEDRVPPSTRKPIRKAFRKHYRPALRASGMQWLMEALRERGSEDQMDDAELERRVTLCLHTLDGVPPHPQSQTAAWWFEQLGVMDATFAGEAVPYALLLDERHRERLVDALVRLPASTSTRARKREPATSRFLLVQSRDRVGLVADVAKVVAEHKLSMTELVALRLPGRRGLIRIHLRLVGADAVKRLAVALRRVSGVTAVESPGARPTHEEAKFFPPRRDAPVARPSRPAPYTLGGEVRSDFNFYGMDNELADLHRVFDEAVAGGSRKGTSAFVCGPKKVGKTSLILAFQRQLEAGQRGPCLTVHLEAAGGEPWSRYSRRFARKLFEAASTMVPDRMKAVADPELKQHGLTEFICEVRRRIGVPLVLALDEAVELCLASQNAGEAEEVLQFNASMAAEAGVMVVWVGPTAALRLLDHGPREMLRDGHRLFVQPLDRSAVSALLRAEKLHSKYAIHADRTVVEMIYRTTFGNPYWTQAIADTMWREKTLEGTELVVYDEGLAKKGIERTQRTDEFFADRYDVWTAEENLMARAILVALARQFRGKRTKKRGFSAAEILTFVRQTGLDPTGAELELMLRVLVDTGAIVEEIHRGAYRWLIAVPLFAQHVLAKLDAVTDTTAGV